MKKILLILITIFYIFISFASIKLFSQKQVNDMLYSNTYKVIISNSNQNLKASEIFNDINTFSKEQNINIYKINHNNSNYLHQNIDIYSCIGNSLLFNKKFNIKNVSENIFEDYNVNLFDKKISMNIKNLNTNNNLPIDGIYYINANNYDINNLAQYFESIGLKISSISYVNSFNVNKPINTDLKIVLIVLALLVSLTIAYYAISKYKEFAIKKLFGFTNGKILLYFLEDIIQIYALAFISSSIITLIYLFYYNRFSYISNYLTYWIINIGLITILLFICNIPSYLLLFRININNMIKNKKPHLTIQLISYITKFIFSMIFIYIFINICSSYSSLNLKYSDNNWQNAKNYCHLEYDVSYMAHPGGTRYYQETQTSKKLFKKLNESSAILIKPSTGDFLENEHIKNTNAQSFGIGPYMYSGNSITVNNNYLKLNPIYNINNQPVNFSNFNNPNEIEILVPVMYKNQENSLLKSYEKWYYNTKYSNEIYHYKQIDEKLPKLDALKVNITFIKNNQKEFLYNTTLQNENKGYSTNAVIAIANPYNLGGDRYLSYLTGGYIMPYIGGKLGYTTLNNQLDNLNLNKYMLSKPSVYSELSSYIYQTNKQINFDCYLLSVLIITELIILAFIALNHIEKNKYLNTVKYIHGYSSLKLYKDYILSVLVLWLLVTILSTILNPNYYLLIILLSITCCIIEIILSLVIFKIYSMKKFKNILKGE